MIPIERAEALLVKRRESREAVSRQRGEVLFFSAEGPVAAQGERQTFWTRDTFGALVPGKAEGFGVQEGEPSRILADAWNEVFNYLSEFRRDVDAGRILDAEPEFPAYGHGGLADTTSVPAEPRPGTGGLPIVDARQRPMAYWPVFPGEQGHLGPDYSQLSDAWNIVRAAREGNTPTAEIRVAILDIGFLPYHRTFASQHSGLIEIADPNRPLATGLPGEPFFPPATYINGPAHGTATAAILAGRPCDVRNGGYLRYFSGGNPDAYLVPIRIGPNVVEGPWRLRKFSRTGDVARGFVLAAEKKAEVLSMSVGGLPSNALADAVNVAYRRGVAMFCAAGDYVLHETGIRTPWYTVFPAVYDNVMAVTGVTADRTPYGSPPKNNWPQETTSLTLGSFGPSDKMSNAIAAWGPNIPWAVLPEYPDNPLPPIGNTSPWNIAGADWGRVDLNGQGTSANTPQVAATASLLVEYRNTELGRYPEPWQKVEAIYHILKVTAEPVKPANRIFYGAGLLRSKEAINRTDWPAAETLTRGKATNGFYWLRLLMSAGQPLPDPEPDFRRLAGLLVGTLLEAPNKPSRFWEAVAVAIETELAQNAAMSVELQRAIDQLPPADAAARRQAVLEILLRMPLSRHARDFLEKIAPRRN